MACIAIGSGYICGTSRRRERKRLKCQGQCGKPKARIVISHGSPYYDSIKSCVECGDTWSDGYLGERPFARGWRQKAIKRHEQMWAAACTCPVERDDDHYPLPCKHSATKSEDN